MKEEWRQIARAGGWYEVSDQGRVRSWISGDKWKKVKRKEPKILKGSTGTGGYIQVAVKYPSGMKTRKVHSLVAETFIALRPAGAVCCHRDGNNKNNAKENLYWGTQKDNMADSRRHGTMIVGEKSCHAKINEQMVRKVRSAIQKGMRQCDIVMRFDLTPRIVQRIKNDTAWRYVV